MSYPGGYDPTIHEAPGGTMPPPQPQQHYGQPMQSGPYPPQAPQVVVVHAAAPVQQGPQYKGSVTKTRPPFPHGKHIKWSIYSFGMWLFLGYPLAYFWHRVGPSKAVSKTTFV